MYAFDAVTGRTLWTTTIGSYVGFYAVTVSGSTVYADTYNSGTVYVFDGATGRVLWSAIPPGYGPTGPVTVAGGLAYVVSASPTTR